MTDENVSACGLYEPQEVNELTCVGCVGSGIALCGKLPMCIADDRRDRRNVIFVEKKGTVTK